MFSDDIVIVAAKRSAVGKFLGSLSKWNACEIGAEVLKECLKEVPIQPSEVDEVIVGQVLQANCGQNPARQTAILAGIPNHTPSFTINKVCGSGLKSVHLGMQAIACDDAQIVVCGGQENMSKAPHVAALRAGQKMGNIAMVDTMISDGLTCAFNKYHMGITAENVATKFSVSRKEQDVFAALSQSKALAAEKSGKFAKQIVKVGELTKDEFINPKSSLERLENMKPAFDKRGSVTAGNASGLNDGAAFVILMKKKKALEIGANILCTLKSFAATGVDPGIMGIAPVSATKKVLEKVKWEVKDVDVIEANEAFAAQAIAVCNELALDPNKVNVNGGAIAIGHPIGASGTRILVDLIYELERRNGGKGVATMCIGGGQGVALAIERDTTSNL